MVQRPARDRQAEALDRVGEDHGRPLGLLTRFGEGAEQIAQVVAPQVVDQRRHLALVSGEEPLEPRPLVRTKVREDGFGHDLFRGAEETLVELVRHLVDPPAQEVAPVARVGLPQPPAVLQLDHLPAVQPEDLLELLGLDDGDDAIEALAVQVDDPEHVRQRPRLRLDDRLPDVALVELRVTENGDEPAAGAAAEVGLHVPVRQRAEERRGRSQTHRARRVVDRERVLRAARVRLEAAVFTKLGQVGTVEPAEQVLDRVQHGRCVRLHRDPVLRLQVEEVEGRHQRDHGGRRGLMAADLEVVTFRPLAVRVVDDPGREPEHPALDRGHRLEIGGRN